MNFGETPNSRRLIEEKIRIAHELLARWGVSLSGDLFISELLACLKQKTVASQQAMKSLDIVAVCRFCEEEDGGSCCGRGIEDKYSPVLLLINLLMGQRLPERRYQEDSCYFLGQKGCCLEAREVICVNYLCRRIQNTVSLCDLVQLQSINGEELDTAFVLTEAIKKFIGNEDRCT